MARSEPQPDMREELRILATQVEAINQQLSGSSGGGNDPALRSQMQQMEQKINFLYELVKNMDAQIAESIKSYFNQVSTHVTKSLDTNLTQLFSKLDEMHQSFATIQEGLHNTPQMQAQDILEMKKSLKLLIDVYKDEVAVFKEQNEYLQKQLESIDKKLSK